MADMVTSLGKQEQQNINLLKDLPKHTDLNATQQGKYVNAIGWLVDEVMVLRLKVEAMQHEICRHHPPCGDPEKAKTRTAKKKPAGK